MDNSLFVTEEGHNTSRSQQQIKVFNASFSSTPERLLMCFLWYYENMKLISMLFDAM